MSKTIRSQGLLALGKKISEVRIGRGMSQRQFASAYGYRQSFIAKVEQGLRRLDAVELVVFARSIDVEPAMLLRVVEEATPIDTRF